MSNLARKLMPTGQAHLEEGTVVRVGAELGVRTGGGEVEARRARSCLVRPEVGDLVLLSTSGDGRAYVLAVLEGRAGAATELGVEGDLRIRLDSGRIDVAAPAGVEVVSGKEVSFVSGTLKVSAFEGSVALQKLSYVGALLRAEVEALRTVATTCDTLVERVTQRVKRSFRFVEDADCVKAGRIDYSAESTLAMRAENTVVTSEELFKVDAEQIHLG